MQFNNEQQVRMMLTGLAKTNTIFSLDNAREFLPEEDIRFIGEKLGVDKGGFYGLLNAVPRLTIIQKNNEFYVNIEADNKNNHELPIDISTIEGGAIAEVAYNLYMMQPIDNLHPEMEELKMKYTAAAAYFSSNYATLVLNEEGLLTDFEPEDLMPTQELKTILHTAPEHNTTEYNR